MTASFSVFTHSLDFLRTMYELYAAYDFFFFTASVLFSSESILGTFLISRAM
jgi:hypothetical protein